MQTRYFRWAQHRQDATAWDLSIEFMEYDDGDLKQGRHIDGWDPCTTAFYEDASAKQTDFPATSFMLPVYSPRLKALVEQHGVTNIQYLPLLVKCRATGNVLQGYHLANYLDIIDCLDRERSDFQVWTQENLLFWEKRPWMLGKFRDVRRAVLAVDQIPDRKVFRLWGWEEMVIVREDLKSAIEAAGITGCWFTELKTVT